MRDPFNVLRSHYDRIAIPTIWLAFALSFMLHALLLSGWLPRVRVFPSEDPLHDKPSNSLAVRLVPLPSPAPTPPPAPAVQARPPSPRIPAPRVAQKPPSAPQILSRESPSPAESARPPANEDFASYVEARRRAREPAARPSQPSPPAETEQERHNRIAAENLGLSQTPSFGAERNRGGGIFQIQRMGFDSADFVFFGWNKFINRNTQQIVEVQRGNNASMELAVVRRMIGIIREHESGDFVWQSRRLGREVSLSARIADNAALEAFMLREFFADARPRN
jgi:hypothetical protein